MAGARIDDAIERPTDVCPAEQTGCLTRYTDPFRDCGRQWCCPDRRNWSAGYEDDRFCFDRPVGSYGDRWFCQRA